MTDTVTGTAALPPQRRAAAEDDLHGYRRELTGYCYRMLGSAYDAEDAVQDTLVRAWRGLDGFDGRASLRSWLYRIATNVCFDIAKGRSRRALPVDLSPSASAPVEASLADVRPGSAFVEPVLDDRVLPEDGDPADLAVARESVRLAFVAALQHLPPRQRAVLILRDVLRWRADEVAGLLGSSVASVNSALQRARAAMAVRVPDRDGSPGRPVDAAEADLLDRYVDAFERYDIDALVTLLHEDATQDMPPFAMWLRGREDIGRWMLGPGAECRGSRLLRVRANGAPAIAQYRPSGPGGRHEPWALHVLDVRDGRVAAVTSFLDTGLFALLGIPQRPGG
jgi:RNA polymerase sigma-70 factor, ECF subfamily